MPDFLGLDDSDGLALQIKQIVRVSVSRCKWELTDRARPGDILSAVIADAPTGCVKQSIDFLSGFVFRASWAQCSFDASPARADFLLFGRSLCKHNTTNAILYNFYVVI